MATPLDSTVSVAEGGDHLNSSHLRQRGGKGYEASVPLPFTRGLRFHDSHSLRGSGSKKRKGIRYVLNECSDDGSAGSPTHAEDSDTISSCGSSSSEDYSSVDNNASSSSDHQMPSSGAATEDSTLARFPAERLPRGGTKRLRDPSMTTEVESIISSPYDTPVKRQAVGQRIQKRVRKGAVAGKPDGAPHPVLSVPAGRLKRLQAALLPQLESLVHRLAESSEGGRQYNVMPKKTIQTLVETLAEPGWGSVEQFTDLEGMGKNKVKKFGADILKLYRQFRFEHIGDVEELTAKEEESLKQLSTNVAARHRLNRGSVANADLIVSDETVRAQSSSPGKVADAPNRASVAPAATTFQPPFFLDPNTPEKPLDVSLHKRGNLGTSVETQQTNTPLISPVRPLAAASPALAAPHRTTFYFAPQLPSHPLSNSVDEKIVTPPRPTLESTASIVDAGIATPQGTYDPYAHDAASVSAAASATIDSSPTLRAADSPPVIPFQKVTQQSVPLFLNPFGQQTKRRTIITSTSPFTGRPLFLQDEIIGSTQNPTSGNPASSLVPLNPVGAERKPSQSIPRLPREPQDVTVGVSCPVEEDPSGVEYLMKMCDDSLFRTPLNSLSTRSPSHLSRPSGGAEGMSSSEQLLFQNIDHNASLNAAKDSGGAQRAVLECDSATAVVELLPSMTEVDAPPLLPHRKASEVFTVEDEGD